MTLSAVVCEEDRKFSLVHFFLHLQGQGKMRPKVGGLLTRAPLGQSTPYVLVGHGRSEMQFWSWDSPAWMGGRWPLFSVPFHPANILSCAPKQSYQNSHLYLSEGKKTVCKPYIRRRFSLAHYSRAHHIYWASGCSETLLCFGISSPSTLTHTCCSPTLARSAVIFSTSLSAAA